MAKKKIIRRIAVALIVVKSGLFLLPSEDGPVFPYAEIKANRQGKKALLKAFEEAGIKARIKEKLTPIVYEEGEGKATLLLPYRAVLLEEPEKGKYLVADSEPKNCPGPMQALVHYAYLYLPYFLGKKREIPLEKEEEEKAQWCLDSLDYFGHRIKKREKERFYGLYLAPSSPSRLFLAYDELLASHKLNPQEYVEYIQYKEAYKKAVR